MNLNNAFSALLMAMLFVSISSHSADENAPMTMSMVINGVTVECHGYKDKRFMACKSEIHDESYFYYGVVDLKPNQSYRHFLPLIMIATSENDDEDKILINITAKIIKGSNNFFAGSKIAIDPAVDFSAQDFFGLNYHDAAYYLEKWKSEIVEKFDLEDKNERKAPPVEFYNRCTESLSCYFMALKKQEGLYGSRVASYQVFLEHGTFLSKFFYEENAPEISEDSLVPIYNADNLSASEKKLYNDLVKSSGKRISLEEAQKLINGMRTENKIYFDHGSDGCYALAHLVANELTEKGIKSGKVILKGQIANPYSDNRPWIYHVAATIYVLVEDQKEIRVIDFLPNLTANILTVDEWLDALYVEEEPLVVPYPVPKRSEFFHPMLICFCSAKPYFFNCHRQGLTDEHLLMRARASNQRFREVDSMNKQTKL